MSYSVEIECSECGFSLTVEEKDIRHVPEDLSPEAKARVVLEDHGWSGLSKEPLCDSCAA